MCSILVILISKTMNLEIKVRCPRPKKSNDHIFFKKYLVDSSSQKYLHHSQMILEDLSKLRGNSQNPQEKDESFKSQSESSMNELPQDSRYSSPEISLQNFEEEMNDQEKTYNLH